ncbi:MAG TPA: hypothetical protein VKD08_06600 [Ignavibacteriaceae bacterium]|nr:hypothetical protein [Ignavibacteriaceae bacterium]
MHRRTFIKSAALSAFALSTYGFAVFDGNKYVGDCETTTDILGPFYLPGSPVRNNLVIKGEPGIPVELSGYIKHDNCLTPYKNAKIELWHCDAEGDYDLSKEYRYRGTAFSGEDGRYSFKTIMPVPYAVGDGSIRPAHFHLMITAAGYQALVTQLYFSGDSYIKSDPYASSPKAKRRILDSEDLDDGTKRVLYNVSLSEVLPVEEPSIDKLTGIYTEVGNQFNEIEIFKNDNTIWMKNEAFGNRFDYTGSNTFEYPGMPDGMFWELKFELLENDIVKLVEKSEVKTSVFLKTIKPSGRKERIKW